MRRRTEYGGVPWYLMFTIATSVGAGIGAYKILHERRLRLAEERARAPKPPPPPAPTPSPRFEEPVPTAPEEAVAEAPVPANPPAGIPDVTIKETLTMGDIEGVAVEIRIGVQREAIEACYRDAQGAGTIPFALSVGPTGRVTAVKVVGEPFDPGVAACVTALLRKIRLPAPTNGEPAEATVPIEFQRI